MSLVLVTAPTVEPVTVEEVKNFGRIDHAVEDRTLKSLIITARQLAEVFTRRQFVTATWRYKLPKWPVAYYGNPFASIELPLPPLQAVTGITYTDLAGASQTLETSVYSVETDGDPGVINLVDGQFWPNLSTIPNAVAITFKAGYGGPGTSITNAASVAAVPETIKTAIKLIVVNWYENRGEAAGFDLPEAAKSLLISERWGSYV